MGNANIKYRTTANEHEHEQSLNESREESVSNVEKTARELEKNKTLILQKIKAANTSGELIVRALDIKPNSEFWAQLPPNLTANARTVDLSENEIKRLPFEILLFERLKCLQASNCALQRIISLASLLEVEIIKLDHNDLEDASTGPLPHASLKNLDLSCNHFKTFPSAVAPLIHLKVLNLNCNRIKSLQGVGTLTSLEVLALDDNNLISLPDDEIINLVNLHELSIKRNLLQKSKPNSNTQTIVKEFFTSTLIEYIAVDGNPGLSSSDLLQYESFDAYKVRNDAFLARGRVPRVANLSLTV